MVYRVGYKPSGLYGFTRVRLNASSINGLVQAIKSLRGITYETELYIHEGVKPYACLWVGTLWQLENGARW